MAMLLVLETLAPTEWAVFVLRDVFDLGYDEIADAVDKNPAAVRQIAHRARAHVAARRPREVVSPTETRQALEAFQRAADTGDLQELLDLLAPDVVFLGDGGGVVRAVLSPVVGVRKVAAVLAAGLRRIDAASLREAQVNGYPALVLRVWTARSTPSWRCASTAAASPGSTRSATRRSCRTWSGRPRCTADGPCSGTVGRWRAPATRSAATSSSVAASSGARPAATAVAGSTRLPPGWSGSWNSAASPVPAFSRSAAGSARSSWSCCAGVRRAR
jgi:hypothetical protein